MKKNPSKAPGVVLAVFQHLFLAAAVFALFMENSGQSTVLHGPEGELSYRLYESDQNRDYEDTALFNNIFGNNLATVARYVAICSQLESGGAYDGDKVVDVTAYVNRSASLPGDYITARYTVSNLIKWASNGFDFNKPIKLTDEETERFFADSTTYTHIINNTVSGGMNSYLNAQIEGNTELRQGGDGIYETGESEKGSDGYVFYDQIYAEKQEREKEEHSILPNRYRTVDGKSIEDLVDNWDDYQTLCMNVVEAGKTLQANYEEYGRLTEYFAEQSTSMRYYIARTIGGRQEIYTNVASLKTEADPEKVSSYFAGLSRHLFYCPYDLRYETDSLLKQETVRTLLRQYSYAYPDQIRVYAGVDLGVEGIADDFHEGQKIAGAFLPAYRSLQFLAFVFLILYLILFVYRLMTNGKKTESRSARIPTELLVLIWVVPMIFLAEGLLFVLRLPDEASVALRTSYISRRTILFCALVFLLSAVFMAGLLALLRRKRSAGFKQNSLLVKCGGLFGEMFRFSQKNRNLAVTTLVLYILFVVVNIVVTAVTFSTDSAFRLPVLLCLILLDAFIGVLLYRNRMRRSEIIEELHRIADGEPAGKLDAAAYGRGELGELAASVNSIGEGIDKAVKTSMQDERLKTELITNVSHDLKTPLTSIINYVDLLKRENIDSPRAAEYIQVLEEKSQQLKHLTEDLVEASKISSGNIEVKAERLNVTEFLRQTIGEFHEKFEEASLRTVLQAPEEPLFIKADAHHLWRVMENLLGNAVKYALPGTRVYLMLSRSAPAETGKTDVVLTVRNVCKNELHVDTADLTERFVRGDMARSGEGSGLGLSIADNLTKAQGGELQIDVDGDLFRVTLWFPEDVLL